MNDHKLTDWRKGPYTLHDKWIAMAEKEGRCQCDGCVAKRAPFVEERADRFPPEVY